MSFLSKLITARMTLAFAALGLAPAPAALAAPAPNCDAKHEICLGDTIVAPFLEDGKLFTGSVAAINPDGTYSVRTDDGKIRKEPRSDIGFAGPGACVKAGSFCAFETVQYKPKPKAPAEKVVAVFLNGEIAVSDTSRGGRIYVEQAMNFSLVSSKYLNWTFVSKNGASQVSGCVEKDAQNPAYLRNATITECQGALSYKILWNDQAHDCALETDQGVLIADEAPAVCANEPGTQFYWIDENAQQCAAGTSDGHFIEFVDKSKCADATLACVKGSGILASVDTAMIDGTLYHLVPSILNLPDGATVPANDYREYSPDLIAASLVARLHEVNEADDNAAKPAQDFQNDTLIQMRFDASLIDSIRKAGFLNQHQIGASKGLLNPSYRATVEDALIDVNLEPSYVDGIHNPVNDVRPKYSFLTFDRAADAQEAESLTGAYGNVVVNFKNEVKDRSTFTPIDSLNAYGEYHGIKARTFAYRSERELDKIPDSTRYWETQTWGDLTLADVDSFMIDCPGDTPVSPESMASLKKTGLPIYQCRYLPDHSHFAQGKLLYPGSAKLLAPPPKQTGSDTSEYANH
jgi:hypothetical protein